MECSIIIPTLNEATTLPATLRRLAAVLADRLTYEVIVVDGGSHDGTPTVARSGGCRLLTTSVAGRARQLNAGARAARGHHLFFLHADTLVPTDFAAHLRTTVPASFRLRFTGDGGSAWLRFFAWCSRFSIDAFRYGDQGLLVAASDFRSVGGYREDHLLFEDHDIVRRLRRYCGDFHVLPAEMVTSDRRYRQHGVVYTQSVYVLLYVLYRTGLSQQRLCEVYRRAFAGRPT